MTVIDEEDDNPDQAGNNPQEEDIEERETPLAVMDNAADAQHCPLHILELILTAVMGGAYIGSTRKQKKEIAKLEDKLGDKER